MSDNNIVKDLEYAASLDEEQRGDGIVRWANDYGDEDLSKLPKNKQKMLRELLYRSINFLKIDKDNIKKHLIDLENIKKFL